MRARTTIALALLVASTGCGADRSDDRPAPDEPGLSSDTGSPSDSATAPDGGTVDDPVVVEPTTALLDWTDTGQQPGSLHVRGEVWSGSITEDRSTAVLSAGGGQLTIEAGPRRVVSELLLTEGWVVVVRQDTAETDPSEVDVVQIATGEEVPFAGPAPASGGSWALTGGDLYYPTYGDDRAYCLATSALADVNGEDGWCAPDGTGFSNLTASEHGVGLMTFDDARPVACRTVNLLDGTGLPQPVEGPADCVAWDVAATADGAVWSEVPKPRRQEEAVFSASADGTFFRLGPGTTGTALPCGDSVFFVRDPQGADDPARLMRWTPDHTLEVAYESPSTGNAFLGEPTCGGGVLTVPSYGESGDELVWATVT